MKSASQRCRITVARDLSMDMVPSLSHCTRWLFNLQEVRTWVYSYRQKCNIEKRKRIGIAKSNTKAKQSNKKKVRFNQRLRKENRNFTYYGLAICHRIQNNHISEEGKTWNQRSIVCQKDTENALKDIKSYKYGLQKDTENSFKDLKS